MTAFSFNKVARKVTKKPLVTVAKNFSLYLQLSKATLHFPGVLFRISSAQVLYRIAVCKKMRNVQKNPVTDLCQECSACEFTCKFTLICFDAEA